MDYKDIIIIILLFILIYYNIPKIKKLLRKLKNYFNPIKYYEIKSDLTLIKKQQKYIQDYILNSIKKDLKNNKIREICLYTLNEGKKIRPIILISLYQQINDNNSKIPLYVLDAACGIEYLHCASLILDDIMDDDNERRGKKSVHFKYGTTKAQLCAIILCTLSMQKIAFSLQELNKDKPFSNKNIPFFLYKQIFDIINELSLGQFIDIDLPTNLSEISDNFADAIKYKKLNFNIYDLIDKKTSSLFEFCYIMPWIFTNSNNSDNNILTGVNNMKKIAKKFGLIFQISDDFEDVEQDLQREGKNSIMNYVIHKGYKKAFDNYQLYLKKFIKISNKNNVMTPEIKEIINYLTEKVKIYHKNKN